jgi:hypothetical protein
MGMPLGATYQTSSSFLVFFGSDRLHGLEHLAEKVLHPVLEFLRRAQHEFDKEAFEQACRDVAIGLVIVLALLV